MDAPASGKVAALDFLDVPLIDRPLRQVSMPDQLSQPRARRAVVVAVVVVHASTATDTHLGLLLHAVCAAVIQRPTGNLGALESRQLETLSGAVAIQLGDEVKRGVENRAVVHEPCDNPPLEGRLGLVEPFQDVVDLCVG